MKRSLLLGCISLFVVAVFAQEDPVLMRVNGREILRSEFEYAYRIDGPYCPKQGLLFDKNRILNEAKEKAEAIINQAEKRAASIVSQDAIVKEATKKAYDILTKAKTAANQMKKEASEYTDSLMNKTERFMTAVLQDVRKTKSELRDKR